MFLNTMNSKIQSNGLITFITFLVFVFGHIMLAAMSASIENSVINAIAYGIVFGLGAVYPVMAQAIVAGEISFLNGLRHVEMKIVPVYSGANAGMDFRVDRQEVRNIVTVNNTVIISGSVVLGIVMSIALALSHGYA